MFTRRWRVIVLNNLNHSVLPGGYLKLGFFGLLWLFFCGFYLTQVTMFSPVYPFFLVSFCYSIFYLSSKTKPSIDSSLLGVSFFSFFVFVLAFYSPVSLLVNYFISISSVFIVASLFKRKTINVVHLFFMFFIYSSLFCVDGAWRITHPDLTNVDKLESLGVGFQIYKSNSLMYADSNFVGIQCVMFISAFLYIFKNVTFVGLRKVVFYFILATLIVATFLTFSRSAYLGVALTFLMYAFCRSRKAFVIFICFSPVLFVGVMYFMVDYFSTDISFGSKFHILDLAFEYLDKSTLLDFIFGVGLGNAESAIGMGAHNVFVSLFIEAGLAGLALFLFSNIIFFMKLGRYFFVVCFPFLFSSMSLGSTAIPYFYTLSAVCVLIEKDYIFIVND
jgi:hypothetical protein